jgi:hypothetical protein
LVIGLALGLARSLDTKTHHRKAALTGCVLEFDTASLVSA